MVTAIAFAGVTVAEGTFAAIQTGSGVGAAIPYSATIEWTRAALLAILGYGLAAGLGAATVAFCYRARTVRELPLGPGVLVGLGVPAVWVTIEAVRQDVLVGAVALTEYPTGAYLLGVVTAGTIAAETGRRIGDHLARGVFDIAALDAGGPIADRIRSAGLAGEVTLPDQIEDVEGYASVADEQKRSLEGQTVLVPQRLSSDELDDRLQTRLASDHDIDIVDVDVTADGTVESLAVGDRPSGISATLPPNRAAIGIRATSSSRGGPGDPVEVWTTDPDPQLVATGTVRDCTAAIATLVVDADDADAFDPGDRYRLTTRPETPTDGNEFVSVLRAADEVVRAVSVAADSNLDGDFVGWIPGTVLVVERDDERLALPADNESVQVGDTLYVCGTPTEHRRLRAGPDADAAGKPGSTG